MCKTDVIINNIKNRDAPNKYFCIHAQNDFYVIKLRYMETGYNQKYKENDINPNAIYFSIKPKQANILPILFLLKTSITEQQVGIDIPDGIILEQQLDTIRNAIQIAQCTIQEIKRLLLNYFHYNA